MSQLPIGTPAQIAAMHAVWRTGRVKDRSMAENLLVTVSGYIPRRLWADPDEVPRIWRTLIRDLDRRAAADGRVICGRIDQAVYQFTALQGDIEPLPAPLLPECEWTHVRLWLGCRTQTASQPVTGASHGHA